MKIGWSGRMYWPAAFASCCGIAVTAGAAFGVGSAVSLVPPAKIALGIFGGFLFLLMGIDREARDALDAYNRSVRYKRYARWSERMFPPEVDRLLAALTLAAWVEGLALLILGDEDLTLLPFLSFLVAGLMIMLMMKYGGPYEPSEEEPGGAVRETGFWMDGDGGD